MRFFDNIRKFLAGLSQREQIILLFGAITFLVFIIFFGSFLAHRKASGKKSKIEQLSEQRVEFAKIASRYASLKQVSDLVDNRVASRPSDFDLYRKTNELIESLGVRAFVAKMDPGQLEGKEFLDEEFVDLNIQKIDLPSLIRFLNNVEQLPGLVIISQLSIKTRLDKSNTLDAVLRISSYREKEIK